MKLSKKDAAALGLAKQHKYRAVKTEVDGITFASKREAKRYGELKAMEKADHIAGLELQPVFVIRINEFKVCEYRADFRYRDLRTRQEIVEDAKGMKTPVYRLKKKLLKACYGIDVREV